MRKFFLRCVVGGVLCAIPLPAMACGGGGGGGCSMGGGRGGYYGGTRSRASTKVLAGGSRAARSTLVNAAKPATAPIDRAARTRLQPAKAILHADQPSLISN